MKKYVKAKKELGQKRETKSNKKSSSGNAPTNATTTNARTTNAIIAFKAAYPFGGGH